MKKSAALLTVMLMLPACVHLVVVPPPKDPQYCGVDVERKPLVVQVRNVGSESPAAASEVRVTFFPGGTQTKALGPLPPGTSHDYKFAVPSNCWHSDCEFVIEVASSPGTSFTSYAKVAGLCIG